MLIEAIDGYYDSQTRTAYAVHEKPRAQAAEPIALRIAEIRAVYEGCWIERAIAFSHHRVSGSQLSVRQRALYRDDPAAARNLRRTYENLDPAVIEFFRTRPRCVRRRIILAAAHSRWKGDGPAQLRAAAAAMGQPDRKSERRSAAA